VSVPIGKVLWVEKGRGVAASGQIPKTAEFFQDHFPDFPILPGVLALEVLKRTAETYLTAEGSSKLTYYSLKKIRAAKFSSYLKPGDDWESRLELMAQEGSQSEWNAKLLHQGRLAASAEFVLEKNRVGQG